MWDGDGDINIVVLDIDLWYNVGDSGVGSEGSSDLLLDNGVSRSRDSWGSNRSGLDNVLSSSINI